ncbi:hypothetical protein [Saccharospirillum sp.]|uniref:hypothetical protein n=1 Tax=Saccharospirillum sp. TaxID=2033801 RepID=UPI0034A08686
MNRLYQLLKDHSGLNLEVLEQHYLTLDNPDDDRELGHRLIQVKPIWYMQLAVSLEQARLSMDARQNHKTFLAMNTDSELQQFALQRSTILAD